MIPVVPAGLNTLPCTVRVSSGLQAAVNAARGGAVVCLDAGAVYPGMVTIPARSDAGWVVIRTDIPLPAGRMRPSLASGLAQLLARQGQPALRFLPRSGRTLVLGVAIGADTLGAQPANLVDVGTLSEKVAADLPQDIAFDRVYIAGRPTQQVRRAFSVQNDGFTLIRSWCEEIHATNTDSQCVAGWGGRGRWLIEDNTLSAASENVLLGGGAPSVPNLVTADVTIRRNHLVKPASWFGKSWNVKNLVESKAGQRVLVEDNVLEGVWFDAAPGHAGMVFKSTNVGNCSSCVTSDWTVRRNLFLRVGAWLAFAGRADQLIGRNNDGSPVFPTDSTVQRLAFVDNYVDSLSVAPYTNQNKPAVLFVADNRDITLSRNTWGVVGGTLESGIVWDISGVNKTPVTNLTLVGNVLSRGKYGIFASATAEGAPSFAKGALGTSVWQTNAIVGRQVGTYPPGTTWHPDLASALAVTGLARSFIDARVAGVVVPR